MDDDQESGGKRKRKFSLVHDTLWHEKLLLIVVQMLHEKIVNEGKRMSRIIYRETI